MTNGQSASARNPGIDLAVADGGERPIVLLRTAARRVAVAGAPQAGEPLSSSPSSTSLLEPDGRLRPDRTSCAKAVRYNAEPPSVAKAVQRGRYGQSPTVPQTHALCGPSDAQLLGCHFSAFHPGRDFLESDIPRDVRRTMFRLQVDAEGREAAVVR